MPIGIELRDVQRIYHKVGGDIIHFELSDEKEKSGDSTILYYGYLSDNGAWIIMENDTGEGTYRFKGGTSLYTANWTARETQTYGLYSALTFGE